MKAYIMWFFAGVIFYSSAVKGFVKGEAFIQYTQQGGVVGFLVNCIFLIGFVICMFQFIYSINQKFRENNIKKNAFSLVFISPFMPVLIIILAYHVMIVNVNINFWIYKMIDMLLIFIAIITQIYVIRKIYKYCDI
jgi:hypothetical protein